MKPSEVIDQMVTVWANDKRPGATYRALARAYVAGTMHGVSAASLAKQTGAGVAQIQVPETEEDLDD